MGIDAVTALDAGLIVVLIALVVICGVTDVLSHRILNLVTLPGLVMGVLLNLAFVLIDWRMGLQYTLSSLIGFTVSSAIFFVIYLTGGGGMGGGDVKMIAVIGAIDPFHFGLQWSLWSIFCSIMAAGAMALVIVTMQGKLISSFRNVFRSMFTAVMPGLEHEQLKLENSTKMPFGYGISVGTLCCVLFFHYGYLPY